MQRNQPLTVVTVRDQLSRSDGADSPFDLDIDSPGLGDRSPVAPAGRSSQGRHSPMSARPLTPTDNALLKQLETMEKERDKREAQRNNNGQQIMDPREVALQQQRAMQSDNIRRRKTERKMQQFSPGFETGNNRTSCLRTMRTLSAQLRGCLKKNVSTIQQNKNEIAKLRMEVKKYGEIGTDCERARIVQLRKEMASLPTTISQLYSSLDTDKNGTLDLDEFLDGLLLVTVGLNRQELHLLWSLFDKNGDNQLDLAEFEAIVGGDDIKQATNPHRRKLSQLTLRRPSMIEAMHAHTKTMRADNIRKKTKQMRQHSKPKKTATFKVKVPNSPKTKKFPTAKPRSKVRTSKLRKDVRRSEDDVTGFMSASCGRVFSKRVNHLKHKPPAEHGLIVWSGQVWEKTPSAPNSSGRLGGYRCMQTQQDDLSPIETGWRALRPVTSEIAGY